MATLIQDAILCGTEKPDSLQRVIRRKQRKQKVKFRLARFERGWTGIVLNAGKIGVPEIHVPGYRDVAEIGERLSGAEGLDDG